MSTPRPEQPDFEAQVKAIVSAVRTALDERDAAKAAPSKHPVRTGIGWVFQNATTLLALLTLIVIGGWLVFRDISPFTVPDALVEDYRQAEDRKALVDDHLALGDDFLDVGQPEAAEEEFNAALELDSSNPEASLGLLKTELFQPIGRGESDPAVAERRLFHLVRKYPKDSHAAAYYGDALLAGGAYSDAARFYDRALQLNPNNATAVSGKGNVSDLENRPEEALALYLHAERLSPNTQMFVNNVAYQNFRLGNYPDAIAKYQRLLTLDQRFLISYFILSQAQRLQGALGEAKASQLTLLRLFEGDRIVRLRRNSGWWAFHTSVPGSNPKVEDQPLPVLLNTPAEKRYYARLSLALTHEVGRAPHAAREEVLRAKRIGLAPARVAEILRAVRFDAALLADHRPQWKVRLDRFESRLRRHIA